MSNLCIKCTTRLKDTHSDFCWCCNREQLTALKTQNDLMMGALKKAQKMSVNSDYRGVWVCMSDALKELEELG